MKVVTGQTIFIVGVGNNARHKTPIFESNVTKVGRKWFSIDTRFMEKDKFSLEDGLSDGKGYSPEWRAFESEQDYNEYLLTPKLRKELESKLYSLNYTQLRRLLETI